VDRLTRKKLKGDSFARDVGYTVEYLGEHRKQAIRYAIVGVAVLAAVLGVFYYLRQQRIARQAALTAAKDIQEAPIGPPPGEGIKSFPTAQERYSAATKAFTDLATKYSGSDEATIAQYHLGSLAKLTLADLYRGQGKISEAERLLRSLIAKPTDFVSQEQATIALAELLIPSNPNEARKLLDPLSTTSRPAVGRAAMGVLSQLPRPQ
jgi:predicted negative regulator of RcsB-dependent stress response